MFSNTSPVYLYLMVSIILSLLCAPAWLVQIKCKVFSKVDVSIPFVSVFLHYAMISNCGKIFQCEKSLANLIEIIWIIPFLILFLTYAKMLILKKYKRTSIKISSVYCVLSISKLNFK
jgi:hypothetical protein